MSWKTIDSFGNAEGVPWVSIGVHGRRKYTQAKFTFSRTVREWLGLEDGDRVLMQKGNDEHDGWLQFSKAATGNEPRAFTVTTKKQGKGNVAFRTSAARLNLPVHSTTKITLDGARLFLAEDRLGRSVIVELPEWARQRKGEHDE